MRHLPLYAFGLGMALTAWALPGCDDERSSSEVHRTAEFQKAALNSRDAMREHMESQKKTAKGKGSPRVR